MTSIFSLCGRFRSCTNRLKSFQESSKSGNGTDRLSRTDRYFIIFGKAAGVVNPRQRTLNNPPLGQDLPFRLDAYRNIDAKPFKPYFDLWMEERDRLGIKSEWLFPDGDDPTQPLPISTLNSWAETFSNILGVPMYWHAMRHFFATALSKANLPDSVIQSIVGWESADMVRVYVDMDTDEEIGKYFNNGEIVAPSQIPLNDLG